MFYQNILYTGKIAFLFCILFIVSGCTEEELSFHEYTVVIEPFFSEHQSDAVFLHIPGALRVGNDGYLYLLDVGEQHILKISADGSIIDTIGNRGQGPGELSRVRNFALDDENNLYLLDDGLRRVSVFRSDGEFINAFTFEGASASSITVNHQREIALYQTAADHAVITTYDTNGTLYQTFSIIEKHAIERDLGSPEATRFAGAFINRALISYNKQSEICILFLGRFEYQRLAVNGEGSVLNVLEGPAIDSLRAKEQAIIENSRRRGERGTFLMNYFADFISTADGNFIILPSNIPILHEINANGNLQKVYRLQLQEGSPFRDFALDRIAVSCESELIASDSQNATLWRINLE